MLDTNQLPLAAGWGASVRIGEKLSRTAKFVKDTYLPFGAYVFSFDVVCLVYVKSIEPNKLGSAGINPSFRWLLIHFAYKSAISPVSQDSAEAVRCAVLLVNPYSSSRRNIVRCDGFICSFSDAKRLMSARFTALPERTRLIACPITTSACDGWNSCFRLYFSGSVVLSSTFPMKLALRFKVLRGTWYPAVSRSSSKSAGFQESFSTPNTAPLSASAWRDR